MTCVFLMRKVIFLFCPILGNHLLMFKKHSKIGIQHIFEKKQTTFDAYYLGQVGVIIWAKFGATKQMAILAQILTPQFFRAAFLARMCGNPILGVFDKHISKMTNLAQIITLKLAKLGPHNNSTL